MRSTVRSTTSCRPAKFSFFRALLIAPSVTPRCSAICLPVRPLSLRFAKAFKFIFLDTTHLGFLRREKGAEVIYYLIEKGYLCTVGGGDLNLQALA